MIEKDRNFKSVSEKGVLEDVSTYVRTYVTYVSTNKQTNKRHPITTTINPEVWENFRQVVHHHEERGVHANDILEGYMAWYCEAYAFKPQQVRISNYFINQPEQVNIAEKQVIVKQRERPDYSKMELEELQKLYDIYVKHPRKHSGDIQLIGYEMKRRLQHEG